jgi:hypothetical protein
VADWKQVGGQAIAAGAPILGRIIGEFIPFPGGGFLAEWGIKKIAEVLGVPSVDATPETISNAIQNTPPDVLAQKFEAIEKEAVSRWDALAKIGVAHAQQNTETAKAINETIREETAQGPSWWHWRHLVGYVVVGNGVMFMIGSAKLMMFGGDIAGLATLVTAITPIFLALCALNGYVAADTTALKVAAITGEAAPTVVGKVIEAVKPAKKK